jgi:hypothetical protein
MVCRWIAKAVLIPAALMFGVGACWISAHAEGFDKPIRKTILDLGSSPDQPDFPRLHIHLSCYYYPTFMVKELDDDGNKGALRISVLRVDEARAPRCIRSLLAGERAIPDHPGYFWGAKGQMVFIIDDDGDGEGQFFSIYDAITLDRTFRDALRFTTKPNFSRAADGNASMRYQRIFFAECSLMKDGADCWRSVVRKIGLRKSPVPKCSGYGATGDGLFSDSTDPSLIAFPVEVVLYAKPVSTILAGPVLCFAAQ